MKLTPKQQEIASFKYGAILVRASSGSDITRVLVERLKMLLEIAKREVLAVTFSKKSCEEIRQRLREGGQLPKYVSVMTFHGFCEMIINSHIVHTRFKTMPQIFAEDDRKKILEETINGNPSLSQWYMDLNDKERKETLYQALDDISFIKRSVILDNDLRWFIKDEQMRNLYLSYREHVDSLNAIDYDDLPLITYQLLIHNPRIADMVRRGFEFICINEAQDLNKAQYMVLRAITGEIHKNVMLIGDEHQSIYSLNGSSSKYMDEWFVKDYSPVVYDLNENLRSAKAIQEYAQAVVPEKSKDEYLPYKGVCKEQAYMSPWEEAMGVVRIINSLLGTEIEGFEGELGYSDIAVIARNKFLLAKIEEELKKNNIPYHYRLNGNSLGFTSKAGRVFDLALMARSNPDDRMHFEMLQSLLGIKDCQSFEELVERIEDDFLKEVVFKASKLQEDGSNVLQTIQSIIEIIKTSDVSTFKSIDEAIVTFNEFSLLENHWNLYAGSVRRGTLSAFYNAVSLGKTSSNPGGSKGVTLSTVHNIRAQQAVVVFLIGMDEGIFPDYRAVEKGKESPEMRQEKDNLFSAINRAQRQLYIFYPKNREMPSGEWTVREKSSLLTPSSEVSNP